MADNDEDDDPNVELQFEADTAWLVNRPALRAPTQTLPELMLEAALVGRERHPFEFAPSMAVIVRAPAADWVKPLTSAATRLASWKHQLSAVTLAKQRGWEAVSSEDEVISVLAKGQRVVGVSNAPELYLPQALVASADLVIEVSAPNAKIIRKAIELATGRAPRRMPHDIAVGLDYPSICTAIRLGSTPAKCVERLIRAGRNRARGDVGLASVPDLRDLHGFGEAMQWAERLLRDLEAWRRGELDFSALERMAVLASDPGLGKSSFVRSLAKSARLPLFVSSVGSWFTKSDGHLGDVIKQIDVLFGAAAAAAPAIVFLDEAEGIPSRARMDPRNSDYWTPVVGHLLTTLDGAGAGSSASSRLIVIGATNFPEKLDAALVRPGRLSKIILIGPPDAKALAGIFRQHLGSELPDADLLELGKFGAGASGADVVGWIKSARAIARFAGRPLTFDDLLLEVCPPQALPPETMRRIAMHEASHAVAMQVLGLAPVRSISTIGVGISGGHTNVAIPNSLMTKSDHEALVIFILAGLCGEEVLIGSASSGAGGNKRSDLARATDILSAVHTSLGMGETLIYRSEPENARHLLTIDSRLAADVERDLRRLHARSTKIVLEYRSTIEEVAEALLAERVLSGDRFREIFETSRRSKPKRPLPEPTRVGGIDG